MLSATALNTYERGAERFSVTECRHVLTNLYRQEQHCACHKQGELTYHKDGGLRADRPCGSYKPGFVITHTHKEHRRCTAMLSESTSRFTASRALRPGPYMPIATEAT